jgi:hypothetical protein
MITMPQTPITEHSFKKWNAIKIEENDGDSEYYYYIIPMPNDSVDDISERPTLISIANDEWKNCDLEEGHYLVSLFDYQDLPMIETEEEVELLYKILTKENLTK